MLNAKDLVAVPPALSRTVTAKLLVPALDAVPDSKPPEVKPKPGGREPDATVQV
jgi:hypothetical protein